jgi:hypothetical protein
MKHGVKESEKEEFVNTAELMFALMLIISLLGLIFLLGGI